MVSHLITHNVLGPCLFRGDLGSYPEEVIEARVRSAMEQGVTQIWLASEDTGMLQLSKAGRSRKCRSLASSKNGRGTPVCLGFDSEVITFERFPAKA